MFDHRDRMRRIHLPQLGNIAPAKHVGIHKDGLAFISTKIRHQESTKAKFCTLILSSCPSHRELTQYQGCNANRLTRPSHERVNQNARSNRLVTIPTTENPNHSAYFL